MARWVLRPYPSLPDSSTRRRGGVHRLGHGCARGIVTGRRPYENGVPRAPNREEPSMTDYREILYEVDEQIATVTFNRPEHRNPISVGMLEEVRAAVHAAQQD